MKHLKKQSLILLLLCFSCAGFSQRHLKGLNCIEAGGGITALGFYVDLEYDRYLSSDDMFKAGIINEFGKFNDVDFNNIVVMAGYFRNIFSISDIVYFNPGLGAITNLYSVSGISEGSTNGNMFNYGLFVGLDIEISLNEKIGFVLEGLQSYYMKKEPGNQVFFAGAGVKYSF